MKKSLLIVASALSLNAFSQAVPSPSWTMENSNFANPSTGIKYMDAVDPNVVWAIGYDGTAPNKNTNIFTRTINGGANFNPGTIWPDTNTYFPGSLQGIDANTAFVSAYLRASQDRGVVFKTTNGGATWTNMNAANMFTVAGTSFLDFCAFTSPSVGIAVGDPAPSNKFEIYRTTDGGATWSQIPGANIPNAQSGEYGLVNIFTKVANNIWFGTNKNRIYHSTDGGQTWSVSGTITGTIALTSTGTGVNDIAFRDPNNGIALLYANSGVAYLYKTTDGGATWTNIPTIDPNMGLNDFCAVPGTNVYASAGAGTGNTIISYSSNDGVSWTDWGSMNIQYLTIDFVNSTTGWAGAFSDPSTASLDGMWKYTGPSLAMSSTPPTAQFIIPPSACTSAAITATNQSTGNPTPTYSWTSVPSGVTFMPSSTATSPTLTFPGNGTYTIVLAATNTASTDITAQVITITNCTAPTAAFTMTSSICAASQVTVTNTSTGSPTPTYMWSTTPSAGVSYTPSPNVATPTVAFSSPGVYTVTMIATNISGTNSAVKTVTVNTVPTLSITSTSTILCTGNSATLTASGATTYTWSTSSNSTSIVVSPTVNTAYSVTGTNAAGCKATKNFTQTVSPCTGVENISGSTTEVFSLYPNPSNGLITLKAQSDISLSISNELGQVVKTVVLSATNNHEAVVDDLRSGVYFVTGNNNAILVKQKVIISK